LLSSAQFLERTEMVGGRRKNDAEHLKDNPRRLGKGWARLVGHGPSTTGPRGSVTGGRIHQPLWRRSRAVSDAKQGLGGQERWEKPLPAESSNSGEFRPWVNRGYPEGRWLLPRISTVRATLAESKAIWDTPIEIHRKADKKSERAGRDTGSGQGPWNLPKRRRC